MGTYNYSNFSYYKVVKLIVDDLENKLFTILPSTKKLDSF